MAYVEGTGGSPAETSNFMLDGSYVTPKTYNKYKPRTFPKKKPQTIQIPLGGGRRGSNVGYAWEDYDRQMALMDKIGEMSAGYSTYGTLGDTIVDYEGKKYLGMERKFDKELQAALVNAIKELSAKNDALEARIAALEG